MERFHSTDYFRTLQERLIAEQDPNIPVIVLAAGTCGQASGVNDLIRITKRELLARELTEKINLRITGCHGFCQMEPSVLIEPTRTFYPNVSITDMVRIIEAVKTGHVLEDLLYLDPETGARIEKQEDIPFFRKQVRMILAKNEKVDPIRIYNYITSGGYSSFLKCMEKENAQWIIDEIKTSGLRGRGGAGFPTGLKWEMLAQKENPTKYIVCNADEGDPGAYMDRSVLEGNPHSIIEGMLIGALATGATRGVIYVRNEYPLAIKHLLIALRQARELGIIGKNIFNTDFSFEIEIVRGAGAFVCGEETSLIHSIEGKMGEPRQRPPFPVQKGIHGKPTIINNVETWANIPLIIEKGAAEFRKIGTPDSAGTKIFSLVGKVKNTGLVEVAMGTTIETIVNEIGGGSSSRARIKAVQTGGPSGGCIPASMFHLPIDYETLKKAGSIMGSGGMIVMDENTCMVDVAKYFMEFLKDESCGKCYTCRKGTQRMYELLQDISTGHATLQTLDLLQNLAEVVRDTTMCGLGQSAANPIFSTLRYFRQEYERHIVEKTCDAFVCKELVGAPCQTACPLGTEAWRYVAHIANGEYESAYKVIRQANPFPSVCARVCSHPCEARCRNGSLGNDPIAIRALKRFVTDRVDPSVYQPARREVNGNHEKKVAIIGSGPAGLSAAHFLSLMGYRVTIFESEAQPGGMLICGIPAYRLPRETLQKEIASLIDDNITLRCSSALGTDYTIDSLLDDGFQAIFLALGAHKSRKLNIEGENLAGVFPAIQFLKAFNLNGQKLASGRVGVIGGGDSAIDAARVALRQEGVTSVSILYRRTRQEMPALAEEVQEALIEGVELHTLVSPVEIFSENGKLAGVRLIKNQLGKRDASGRRNPVPVPGSEFTMPLDTLIVTIGDVPDIDFIKSMSVDISDWGTLLIDAETLATSRPGVFAGGDVVRGPNTVVQAIADGKKAAVILDRFLSQKNLRQPPQSVLPQQFVEPSLLTEEQLETARRTEPKTLDPAVRRRCYEEVEFALSVTEATQEARRCLRCDLEFTQPQTEYAIPVKGGI